MQQPPAGTQALRLIYGKLDFTEPLLLLVISCIPMSHVIG